MNKVNKVFPWEQSFICWVVNCCFKNCYYLKKCLFYAYECRQHSWSLVPMRLENAWDFLELELWMILNYRVGMGIKLSSCVRRTCVLNLKAISLASILKIIYYFMCICICLHVCMWMSCMPLACGGQKGMVDIL